MDEHEVRAADRTGIQTRSQTPRRKRALIFLGVISALFAASWLGDAESDRSGRRSLSMAIRSTTSLGGGSFSFNLDAVFSLRL